jgi:hypothetical protein
MTDIPGSPPSGPTTAVHSSSATPAALQAPAVGADARPRIRCRVELGLGPLQGFQPQQSHVRLVVEHQEGIKRYAASQPVPVSAACSLLGCPLHCSGKQLPVMYCLPHDSLQRVVGVSLERHHPWLAFAALRHAFSSSVSAAVSNNLHSPLLTAFRCCPLPPLPSSIPSTRCSWQACPPALAGAMGPK